jgi:hypothetical protein
MKSHLLGLLCDGARIGHSKEFSEYAYRLAGEPKQVYIIPIIG